MWDNYALLHKLDQKDINLDDIVSPKDLRFDVDGAFAGEVYFPCEGHGRLMFARLLSCFNYDDPGWDLRDGVYCVHKSTVLPEMNFFDITQNTTFYLGWKCVLGASGFGFVKDHEGEYFPIPHFGRVVIEKNVSIGNLANIDRGVIGNTIIRSGVKIDSHVHIAHNVEIGENTLIVAGSIIGGSVKIGKNCYLGMGCMIKNKVTIGDGATIGMGAVILNDVPAGETWVGNPGRKLEK
jgi:UDP-3-O-[3-hydroxymyristoyl] glucosamine N-acyltransferase LpxD